MVNTLKTKAGENDECYTPPEVFTTLGIRFDLDVAAPQGGIPWLPADRYLTRQEDALVCEWHGRVWMNPPYSAPKLWVARFIEHANGIALLPTSTGKWMNDLWSAPTSWCMADRLRFAKPDGTRYKSTLPTRVWLIAIGDTNHQALARYGKVR